LFSFAFALAFTQNFTAILLSPYSFALARAALVAKELYIAAVLFLAALIFAAAMVRGVAPFRKPVVVTWAVVAGLFLCAGISPAFNWLSFRQLLIIPLLTLYGACFTERTELRYVWTIMLAMLIAVCLSGYLERFVLFDSQEQFWRAAGIGPYMHMKGFGAWAFGPWGLPGNFYSTDLLSVLGVPVRRMASVLISEPTLLGQLLVLPFLYSWFARRWIWAAFFGIAILCAVSKGGLLGCVLGLGCWSYQRRGSAVKKVLIPVAMAGLGLGLVVLVRSGMVGSMALHFRGLATNVLSMIQHPLGKGIGGAGNFAVLAAESGGSGNAVQSLATSGESYVGTVIGQLGFVGLAAYVGLGWWLWRLRVDPGKPIEEAVKFGALATLVMGVASESAISYVGSGYIFALVGFLWIGKSTTSTLALAPLTNSEAPA
jgi:hypothetical protein